MVEVIFCNGNKNKYVPIARAEGMQIGFRSDQGAPDAGPFALIDINWKAYDEAKHYQKVRQYAPTLCVAPDITSWGDLEKILEYGRELARHAKHVIFVPKLIGVIEKIPREPWVVLGYSVPSKYGSAGEVLPHEFKDRPVHLLGGTPHGQFALNKIMNVFSVDVKAHMAAAQFGDIWEPYRWMGKYQCKTCQQWVGRAREFEPVGPNLPYRCFALSCRNIMKTWKALSYDNPRQPFPVQWKQLNFML